MAAGNLVLIPLDGCSLNPARSMATAVTNNKWEDHWYGNYEQLLRDALHSSSTD